MAPCIVISHVCGFVTAGKRARDVRTLLQPTRAQCLRLSERFFITVSIATMKSSWHGRCDRLFSFWKISTANLLILWRHFPTEPRNV